jgi:hypothetical protein
MIEVLPTDWSPRNTSLYLAKGANELLVGRLPDEAALLGDDEAAAESLMLVCCSVFGCDGDWYYD